MSARKSVKINVIKGSFIKRVTTLSLIVISTFLLVTQSGISIAAEYPPIPAPSLPPAPLPSAPAVPSAAPSAQPMPSPIALPPVTAPVQVVVVKADEKPVAPAIPVAANNTLSQVAVDGKFVNIQIAPQKDPAPGTVGVAVVGDGFNFSLSTTWQVLVNE